jgi:hypothetical protein
MMVRWFRRLIILALVLVAFAGVAFFGLRIEKERAQDQYDRLVTLEIETAIADALNNATRAAEVDLPQYRVIVLSASETLTDVALQYNTSVDALRMANGLLPEVTYGSGGLLIVPEGVLRFEPPRRLSVYTAVAGDTLSTLASNFDVPLEVLQADNPILARRGVIPGDTVFIAELL